MFRLPRIASRSFVTNPVPAGLFCYSTATPSVCVEKIKNFLFQLETEISRELTAKGYFTTIFDTNILQVGTIHSMRSQAIALRNEGRFQPSWSESIDSVTGLTTRFDKEGVFACEPDGADYETAPDLLLYMTAVITHLPPILNDTNEELQLSNQSFNAKLAVTLPGGSTYPLHVDNIQGLQGNDVRKLTVILYLNPSYEEKDGGQLRLYLANEAIVDLFPIGGRLVMFWSDEIPHEVLPTAPDAHKYNESLDRYALTIWLPTDNPRNIHNKPLPFKNHGKKSLEISTL